MAVILYGYIFVMILLGPWKMSAPWVVPIKFESPWCRDMHNTLHPRWGVPFLITRPPYGHWALDSLNGKQFRPSWVTNTHSHFTNISLQTAVNNGGSPQCLTLHFERLHFHLFKRRHLNRQYWQMSKGVCGSTHTNLLDVHLCVSLPVCRPCQRTATGLKRLNREKGRRGNGRVAEPAKQAQAVHQIGLFDCTGSRGSRGVERADRQT